MKVALIHYWLTGMRGGEKVLERLCRIFPQADIFTHVLDRSAVSEEILQHSIRTTFIARLPGAVTCCRHYLPLMPAALEQIDLRGYDLVISSEAGPAKGVLTAPDCLHVCYCHSPMRYIWDRYQDYLESFGPVTRAAFKLFAHRLRLWDYASAARVDRFIANSLWVAGRIRKYYRREAEVIYPPVDCARFRPADGVFTPPPADAPYVFLGQLVAYKRADLAIQAFNASGRKLLIIGDGEQRKKLQAEAGPNITFALRRDDAETARLLAAARALVFPGEEDFGIVPLEAAAAGRPVLAYARGGALETVKDGVTGLFFAEQTPESLNAGLDRLEAMHEAFDPAVLSAWAANFDTEVFDRRMREYMELALDRGPHCVRNDRPVSLGENLLKPMGVQGNHSPAGSRAEPWPPEA